MKPKLLETYSSAKTTVSKTSASYTNGNSGSHPNLPVNSQTAIDAGLSQTNYSVEPDRLPGEVDSGIETELTKALTRKAESMLLGLENDSIYQVYNDENLVFKSRDNKFYTSSLSSGSNPVAINRNEALGLLLSKDNWSAMKANTTPILTAKRIAEANRKKPVVLTVKQIAEATAAEYEVYGIKGTKNTPFRRSFKSDEARSKWLDKNADNTEVQGFRDPESNAKDGVKESISVAPLMEGSTVAGLFPGVYVTIKERSTGKRVDGGIVNKISRTSIFVANEEYDQKDYQFVRLA